MLLYGLELGVDRSPKLHWAGTESGEVFWDCRYTLTQILTLASRHFSC